MSGPVMYSSPVNAYRAGRRHARKGMDPARECAWPGHYMDGYRSISGAAHDGGLRTKHERSE